MPTAGRAGNPAAGRSPRRSSPARRAPSACTVGSALEHARVAQLLGVAVGRTERRVARLACAGGTNVSRHHARYDGILSCGAASLISGGGKGCFWGCLGLADCAEACDFDAIEMDAHDLPVVDEARCTACGDCVTVCPKDLFSIHPVDERVWVACASLDAGDGLLDDCQVACTACGRCAQDAPGLITMQDNLPLIDYHRPGAARLGQIGRSPADRPSDAVPPGRSSGSIPTPARREDPRPGRSFERKRDPNAPT